MEEGQERDSSPDEEGHVIDDEDEDSPTVPTRNCESLFMMNPESENMLLVYYESMTC